MFKRFPFYVLMQAASGEGGGGGGSPGGDGALGGGDAPKYVTEERFNELMNKALGARDKRFEAKVTEMFGGFGKTLEERLASLAPKPPEEQAPGDKKVDPELVKLRQMFEAQQKVLDTERSARQAAEAKSRNEKATAQLAAALGKVVRPEAAQVLLKAFRGDIEFDGDEPTMPLPDGSGRSTIDAAIAAWAKTDDAKSFIPAPTSGGSGTQPRPQGPARGGRDLTNVPPAQWTQAERDAQFAKNAAMLEERAKNNPFSFG